MAPQSFPSLRVMGISATLPDPGCGGRSRCHMSEIPGRKLCHGVRRSSQKSYVSEATIWVTMGGGCSQLSQGISSVFRPLGIESHSSKVYQCLPTPGSSPPRVCRQATRVVMTNTIRINKQLINFMYYLNAVSIILLRMI